MKLKSQKLLEQIVLDLYQESLSSTLDFAHILRQIFNKNQIAPVTKATLISTYRQLVKNKKLKANKKFEQLMTKRAVRTLSGVSVITVLTKPFVCPGKCVYCPDEQDMPKSYLSNEPAAARAKANLFDPVRQVTMRIQALKNNGHEVDKLEILVLGGTWSVYPSAYQEKFIRDCFYAANIFGKIKKRKPQTLEQEQKINEKSRYKIIGLTLETRPDFVSEIEIKKMRILGTTRVQLGIQHTDNKILKYIRRGHTLEQSIQATRLLKEAGFKVDHHYMPDLPGSTPARDLVMFKYVFSSPDLTPDQIKIYPCIVNKYAEIYKWHKSGKYRPMSIKQLASLLLKVKQLTPPYMRINRLIRDIPKESIIAGNKITNLRQYLQAELARQGKSCQCIRCREIKGDIFNPKNIRLVKREYPASGGTEIFLSYESKDKKKIYAFLRLRFNQDPHDPALVRELHVYGQMIPVGSAAAGTQHLGLGKKLMQEAEALTKKQGLNKISVISGIGVRDYYRRLGYRLEDTYMVKTLTQHHF